MRQAAWLARAWLRGEGPLMQARWLCPRWPSEPAAAVPPWHGKRCRGDPSPSEPSDLLPASRRPRCPPTRRHEAPPTDRLPSLRLPLLLVGCQGGAVTARSGRRLPMPHTAIKGTQRSRNAGKSPTSGPT